MVMSHVIDAATGQPHPMGHQILGALGTALVLFGAGSAGATSRFDADKPTDVRGDAIDLWQRHVDGQVIDAARQVRGDALGAGAGGFPRDFEAVRRRVWEEKLRPLNGMRLFQQTRDVPLGARTHTARRVVGSGEAEIYRGGSYTPKSQATWLEEQFGVVYVVSSVGVNFFEALSNDFAGRNQYQRELMMARRAVEERLNRVIWNGVPDAKVYGVLDYPHLAKMHVGALNGGTGDAAVALLNDLANEAYLQSGSTFFSNRMVFAPALHRYVTQTRLSTTSGTDTTIAKFFLEGQDPATGIRQIDIAQELAGIGPNGEDGIFCYRDDAEATEHVMIQAPTTLPVFQASPLDQTTVMFAATGGMVMGDLGNNILGYATL